MRRLLPLGAALVFSLYSLTGTLQAHESDLSEHSDLRDAPRSRKGRGLSTWTPAEVKAGFWKNIYQLEAMNAMYTDRHGGRQYVENIRKYLKRLPPESRQDLMKRFLGISYSYHVKENEEVSPTRRSRHQRRFNSMVRDYYELAQRERIQNGNSTYEELFSSIRMLANVGPEGLGSIV